MPRIRTIKPEFWCSEQIVECSTNARLLFVGLWNFADDQGVHPASAKQLKMEVFPGDSFTIQQIVEWVSELRAAGLVAQYRCAQGLYWWAVTGWHHQKIERPSNKYPPPQEDEKSATVRRPFDECSTNARPGRESTVRESRKGRERKGEEGSSAGVAAQHPVEQSSTSAAGKAPPDNGKTARTPSADIDAVVAHYQEYHPRAQPGAKERGKISARLREGYSVGDLIEAIDGCHRTPHNLGANERGQKYLDLELIVRDSSHVARYLENNRNPPRPRNEREARVLYAAERWASRTEDQP